jgi:uncharacterized protein (TIGR02118 family)
MVKLVVMYGHPTDPEAFEANYAEKHLPTAAKIKGVSRLEHQMEVLLQIIE